VEGILFIRMAGVEAGHLVRLEIQDQDQGLTVSGGEWTVTAAGALGVQDFTVGIAVDVPQPVTIQARILVDGQLIGWTDIEIHLSP
jgi:hypothetical protein